MEYSIYVLKHAYSYAVDFLSMVTLAAILIPIEIASVISIQRTRYNPLPTFINAVIATLRTHNMEVPEDYGKHIMVGIIKSRFALGALLYLLGYISVYSVVWLGISGMGTGLWIYYLLKIIGREMNQEAMPVPVQRILEPIITAMVDREDVEPIDFTPWVDQELVWAINGDIRHLIRDANADILTNSRHPVNPLTREPIHNLTRSRINFRVETD